MLKNFKLLTVIGIILASLFLRLHNYDVYPQRGATSDEYTYSFLGVSLLTEHKPVSWSYFGTYKKRTDLVIRKIYFPIVEPYFDHPPLYALIVGAWSLLFGQNTFQKIDLHTIRLMPIFLSLISSLLIYLIAKNLYGYKTALWSLLIFSTVTVFVINMRVVVSENLLAVWFLAIAYMATRLREKISTKTAIIVGSVAGLALLTKILGITAFFSAFFFFLDEQVHIKKFTIMICSFLFFVAILFAYGFYFGKDTFLQIQFAQAARDIGPQTFFYVLKTPIIINKVYQDGWYLFGFFALFFCCFDYKRNKAILIPPIIYLLLLTISLTQEGQSGWYLIPFFPFMSIAIAHTLIESFKKVNLLPVFFLFFIGLEQFHVLFEIPFGPSSLFYRLFVLLLILPVLLLVFTKKERLYRLVLSFWFYLFILSNIYITYNYIHPA